MKTLAPPPPSATPRPTLPKNIARLLRRLMRKELLLKIARFPLLLAAILPCFWLAEGLVDFAFGLSWVARLILLLGSLAFASWLLHRHVYLPIVGKLNLRTAALLVERSFPQFRSGLISTVEFTTTKELSSSMSKELVQILIDRTSRAVDQTDILRHIIPTRPLWRLLATAVISVWAFALILWWLQPQSLVLARRIFLSTETLPRRTMVLPVTRDLSVNTGTDLNLTARAAGIIPKTGRVILLYEDGHSETIPAAAQVSDPSLFTAVLRNVLQPFRYHFEINDGTGEQFNVTTHTLPSLVRTKFLYQPPSYTGRPATELSAGSLSVLGESRMMVEGESTQPLRSAVLELKGLGKTIPMDNDDPAHNMRLQIDELQAQANDMQATLDALNKEATADAADLADAQKAQGEAQKARDAAPPGDDQRRLNYRWELAGNVVRQAQGECDGVAGRIKQNQDLLRETTRQVEEHKQLLEKILKEPAPDAQTLEKRKRIVRAEIDIPKEGLTGLSIHMVNQEGLASENDPVYRINLLVDHPPTIEFIEPKSDQKTVLSEDQVPIKFNVKDDYKIERIDVKYVILRPNAEGEAVPAENGSVPISFPAGSVNVTSNYTIKLDSFVPPITEGCIVSYRIDARDYFTLYTDGNISRKMSLIVVSPEKKKEELLDEMAKAAKLIENLSAHQNRANDKTISSLKQ